MSLFINDTIISRRSQRGAARSFKIVAEGLIERFNKQVVVCSAFPERYGNVRYLPTVHLNGNRVARIHDLIASAACLALRPSVIYSHYYGALRVRTPEVFMVHDMMHELFPNYFPLKEPYNRRFIAEKKSCIERGASLIATSHSTAQDILRLYPHISPQKIVVAYQGVEEFFFQNSESTIQQTGKPFFLYVGHRNVYKNFFRLLVAYAQSGLASEFDLRVISPTVATFTEDERKIIDQYSLGRNVHLLPSAQDQLLQKSYAQATAYVYPSEYEGFGMTILEAMASGTLVATSQVASLPEVGGDVAFYFDPYSAESIAACLREIAELPEDVRRARIAQGRARARSFTWDRCVDEFADVLQRFM